MLAFSIGFVLGAVVTHVTRAQYASAGQYIAGKIAAFRAARSSGGKTP